MHLLVKNDAISLRNSLSGTFWINKDGRPIGCVPATGCVPVISAVAATCRSEIVAACEEACVGILCRFAMAKTIK